jgi:hypothetical protein
MKESENNMTQVAVIHSAFEDTPNTVAFVEVGERTGEEALEYAYRWTNNVMGSWSIKEKFIGSHENGDYNEDVTVMAPLHVDKEGKEWGHRSTSMGDQMLLGTTKYKVAAFGFEKI